jgi:hypothetical protein
MESDYDYWWQITLNKTTYDENISYYMQKCAYDSLLKCT